MLTNDLRPVGIRAEDETTRERHEHNPFFPDWPNTYAAHSPSIKTLASKTTRSSFDSNDIVAFVASGGAQQCRDTRNGFLHGRLGM